MEQQSDYLGQILISMGVIDEAQLQEGLDHHKKKGLRIGEALRDLGHVTAEDVAEALSRQFGLKLIDPAAMRLAPEVLKLVQKSTALEHSVIPVEATEDHITIATADPLDLYAIDCVRMYTDRDVDCVLATEEAIKKAINNSYGVEDETVDNLIHEYTESEIKYGEAEDTGGESPDDAPVIRLVTLIINEAVKARASDIHIEPLADRVRIRYRIDGLCFEVQSPPKRLQGSIIARIKIMAKMDLAEKRRPQDGRIPLKVADRDIDLRVSSLPAHNGESMVMRILDKQSVLLGIQDLGLSDEDYERFQNIIRVPNGIFLVTGPTGSGKTTTLYAALNELNTPDRKIITAEDPVEYNLSGINQCEVKHEVGLDFTRILRAMLRQAPEVILIGEIRDAEAADSAIRAALTGHLVFSTLHTNDAPSAITRLINMGVAPFLVSSSVQAIMGQRLLRRMCSACREPHEYKDYELMSIGLQPHQARNVTFYMGKGCSECNSTGYRGRVGIFELMEMDTTIREMAFRKEGYNRIRDQAITNGMTTLQQDGIRKVVGGMTTIEEVLRVTAEAVSA